MPALWRKRRACDREIRHICPRKKLSDAYPSGRDGENIRPPVTHANLQKLATAFSGMEQVLVRSQGGSADYDALLEFRRFCWAALLLLDDLECQDQIDLLVRYAKELYSDCERDRVDTLRASIGTALSTMRERLHSVERYGKRWRDLRAA